MSKQIISRDKFLEHGVHYGHRTSSWNPAMKPFIAKSMKGIHLINIDKTSTSLENAYQIAKRITEKKGTFLFVGTGKQSSKTVRENAERVGAFYIDHRWLGGLLTNFRTIQNSVNKLRRLERLAKEEFKGYTKKEAILMQKELDKLEKALGGIKFMRRTPQAIFVASIRNEDIAIKEAKKMRIPVFGIADTNVDPFTVNFPIFANDDGNKSAALITTVIADGIAAAKNERQLAAYVADEKVSVMGINPESERKPMERKFQRRDNDSRRTEKPARREEAKPAPKVEEVKEAPKVVEVKEKCKPEGRGGEEEKRRHTQKERERSGGKKAARKKEEGHEGDSTLRKKEKNIKRKDVRGKYAMED